MWTHDIRRHSVCLATTLGAHPKPNTARYQWWLLNGSSPGAVTCHPDLPMLSDGRYMSPGQRQRHLERCTCGKSRWRTSATEWLVVAGSSCGMDSCGSGWSWLDVVKSVGKNDADEGKCWWDLPVSNEGSLGAPYSLSSYCHVFFCLHVQVYVHTYLT